MMGFLTSAGSGDIVFFGTIHPQTLSVGFWKTASFVGFRFRRQRAHRQALPVELWSQGQPGCHPPGNGFVVAQESLDGRGLVEPPP